MPFFKTTLFSFLFFSAFISVGQSPLQQSQQLAENQQFEEAYVLLKEQAQAQTCAPCSHELATYSYKAGMLKATIGHAKEGLALDSAGQNLLWLIGLAYEKRGNYSEAYNYAVKLKNTDTTVAAYCKRKAALAIKVQKPNEAIRAYMSALKLNPKDEATALDLSQLLYKLNLFKEAKHIAQQYWVRDDQNIGLTEIMAKAQYKLKAYDEALAYANHSFTLTDTTKEMATIAAACLVKTNENERALSILKYLKRNHEFSETLYFYKATAFENLEAIDSAKVNYQLALEASQSPNLGQYHLSLGLILDKQERYDEALEHYQKAYALLNEKVILYYSGRAADNYYKDKKVAMRYYERFVALSDTVENQNTDYASHRIAEIKKVMHLKMDTL